MEWKYKYFKADSKLDNWGDATKMLSVILEPLDRLREYVGSPIYVTSGYREGSTSQHGKGVAVDVICPEVDLLNFYLMAERFQFQGIGVYPDWQYAGKQVGGLHLDMRAEKAARWMGVNYDGKQLYISLNKLNLRLAGVLD